MTHIADAELGEWIKVGETYELHRSPKRVADSENVLVEERTAEFARTLAKFRMRLGARPSLSRDDVKNTVDSFIRLEHTAADEASFLSRYAELDAIRAQTPRERFFQRVALCFTPEQLAGMATNHRIVLSQRANGLQVQMPAGCSDAWRELAVEERLYDSSLDQLPRSDDADGFRIGLVGRNGMPFQPIVSLYKDQDDQGVSVELRLTEADGRIAASISTMVNPDWDVARPMPYHAGEPPEIRVDRKTIELAGAFLRGIIGSRGKVVPLSKSTAELLLDPVHHDPLDLFASDPLFALAEARRENLVAVLDDRSAQAVSGAVTAKGVIAKRLERRLLNYEVENESGGWLTFAEKNVGLSDDIRIDRSALAMLLRNSLANGHVGIDDAADFAATSPRFDKNSIARAYTNLLFGATNAGALNLNPPDSLRLYGHLTKPQRWSPGVPFPNLESAAQGSVLYLVYWQQLAKVFSSGAPTEAGAATAPQGFAFEPTDSLPAGLSSSTELILRRPHHAALLATFRRNGHSVEAETSPESLADAMVDLASASDFIGLRQADVSEIALLLRFDPTTSLAPAPLRDVRPKGDLQPGLALLTPEMRKRYDSALAFARKQAAQDRATNTSGGVGGP